jgi:hypothetical protein
MNNNIIYFHKNNFFNLINKISYNSIKKYYKKIKIMSNYYFKYKDNKSIVYTNNFNNKLDYLSKYLKLINNGGIIFLDNIIVNNDNFNNFNFLIVNNEILFIKLDEKEVSNLIKYIKDNNNYNDIIYYIENNYKISKNLLSIHNKNNIFDFTNTNKFKLNKYDFIELNYNNFLKYNYSVSNLKENSNYIELLKKYKSSNFKILLVSSDDDENSFQNICNNHKKLTDIGYNTSSIYFSKNKINNNNLNNFYNFKYSSNLKNIKKIRHKILNNFGYPDLIITKNNDTPKFSKQLFPFSYICHLVSDINEKNIFLKEKSINNKCSNEIICEDTLGLYDIVENFTKKRYLISSTQEPGYGGAATNSYKLVKWLRKYNFNVIGIFFEERLNYNYDKYNIVRSRLYNRQDEVIEMLGGKPDFIFSKNWIAPKIAKRIFPNSSHIYLVSGSIHATVFGNVNTFLLDSFKKSKRKMLGKIKKDRHAHRSIPKEQEIIKMSDFVILNSNLTLKVFNKYYCEDIYDIKNKCIVSDTSDIKNNISIKINDNLKSNDILFVASKLDRTVKNFELFLSIISKKEFDNYKKIIIGMNSDLFEGIEHLKNCEIIDCVDNDKISKYYKKSKILLITSYFDSSPNVLNEALENNCEVITSKNIGTFQYLDESNIIENHNDINEWIQKIKNKINKPNKIIYNI